MKKFLCVALLVLALASKTPPIENVVVIMMENHSFDNMLGWMEGVGDLKGDEYNLANTSDTSSTRFFSHKGQKSHDAGYCTFPDPGHGFTDTNKQIFGYKDYMDPSSVETMGGFAQNYIGHNGNPDNIMSAFTPDQLPILSTLAQEFVVTTNYYSSIPGPTAPNRLFVHAATSQGYNGGDYAHYPMTARTIQEDLEAEGYTWAIHFHDFTTAHGIYPMNESTSNYVQDLEFKEFYQHIANGTLPNYTFLTGALGPMKDEAGRIIRASTQHPVYDIRPGEQMIKDIYEALRNSEYWEKSLFMVVYDEHGGFWDKKVPPRSVNPCPTCESQPYPFDFERLGVRIPGVFVSPWVDKFDVDDTVYDQCVVAATLRSIFNLTSPPLTPREAAIPPFTRWRSSPRTDAPTTLPAVSYDQVPYCDPPDVDTAVHDLAAEMMEMYKQLLSIRGLLDAVGMDAETVTNDWEASEWLRRASKLLSRQ